MSTKLLNRLMLVIAFDRICIENWHHLLLLGFVTHSGGAVFLYTVDREAPQTFVPFLKYLLDLGGENSQQ